MARDGAGARGGKPARRSKAVSEKAAKAKSRPKKPKGGDTASRGAPVQKSASSRARPTYEQIRFIVPGGTRTFYREAAWLEGRPFEAFMREAIHAAALEVMRKHGKACDPPPVHPERPPPLSPNR
ncbi:MAG: hypothetical protein KF729_36350 [Sandaracinaceae bacterium]|nr:hypothetical protein [Sandaracinaceae bacterium]